LQELGKSTELFRSLGQIFDLRTSEYEGRVFPSRLRRLVVNLILAFIVTVG